MNSLLAIAAILFTASAVLAGDIDLYSFKMENGDLYSFSIDRPLYDKQPVIELCQQDVPLSPGKAAVIARDAVRNLLPAEYYSRLRCGAMMVSQIPNPDDGGAVNSKRWMYHAQLRTDKSDVLGAVPMLYNRVIVLMDGTPILLHKQ
jgi:hypothetical protein